jgi:GNAT superfamily N-acetyltransferase
VTHGDITLRPGVPADAAALAEFAARAFVDAFAAQNRDEDIRLHLSRAYGVAQQARELVDVDIASVLAWREDTLVAFAQVQRDAAPACVASSNAVELKRFYVDRSMHGRGLAARLMDAVFEAARSYGATHTWLGVWEHNPRAIAFYAKSGFVDVGHQVFRLGNDDQTDRLMLATVPPRVKVAT